MSIKERIMWTGILIVILVFSLFIINQYRNKLSDLMEEKEVLSSKYTKLKHENQNLTITVRNLNIDLKSQNELIYNLPQIDQSMIKILLDNKGFQSEIKDIESNLLNRSDLIPYEGILGGIMHFHEDGIHVVTDKWVVASFGDGHMEGYMILSYDLNDEKITWKVIDSYLY